MSTTVDNRVLEMRFDNKQFESGVATSMSTLDKLKQKLNLSGASKGLQGLGKAAKNVSFAGMSSGIETVNAKFSAMQVIGMTALSNITNQAVNAGKRMASALTIDPIKTGFQEYETQIGAIQTILSNTRQEGTNVEIVNRALDELNQYADKTIYNFTEMTRNIGTFTAAGVKLDTSVNAIKGIANLAAVSGSTSQQASTAMYQLSQALAAGKVSLMDWNSVVNAGMGGKVFQDALIRTSELLGTGAKQAIETYGSFRESLTQGEWLTTEVLTETLNQLSGAYDKADLIAQGFTESQANEIMALAKDAEDAATKVKTFTQLWDVMKEAAQSGWAQTWRIIIGDFEEAKNLLTPLADFFTGIIGKFSEARNKLLEGGLGKNILDFKMFDGLKKSIDKVISPAKKAVDTVNNVKTSIKDLGSVVDEVIGGKLGNGKERFDSLTKSGYNWMEVQNKVNEKLGNTYRYTKDQIAAQDKLLGSQKKTTEATKESAEATGEATEETGKLTEAEKDRLKKLAKMTEEQARANGYSEEQIAALKELKNVADQLGLPLDELIDNIDELNGRWLLINSFKNIGEALGKVFGSLGDAWRDVFDPIKPEQIFNAVAAMHKFTESLIMSDENAEKLRSTFKGLFAALDLVTTIAGGGIKFAFKALSAILGAFDLNILDVTAGIGEAIYGFKEWLFEQNAIAKALDGFVSKLPGYVGRLKEWFNAFKETPAVKGFLTAIEKIKDAFSKFSIGEIDLSGLAHSLGTNLAKALMSIPDMMVQIGRDVIQGFQNGIEEGISGSIIGKIISFCTEFIAAFASALGCHSPSVKTHEIGVNTMQGFINGIKEGLAPVLSVIKYIGEQILNAFKFIWDLVTDESGDIEWDKLFAGGLLVGGIIIFKQFIDAIKGVADGIAGIGNILENAGDAIKSFSKVLNGYAWDLKAKAIQKMAISIAILVGAIYVLTTIDDVGKLWNAVGVIAALAGIVAALAIAMELMSKSSIKLEKGKLNIEGLKSSILQIGATLLMLAFVVKLIGDMSPEQAKKGFIGLAGMAVGLMAFMAVVGKLVKGDAMENIDKVGKMMTKLAIAMILMVGVCKLVSGLSAEDMIQGGIFAAAFAAFVIAITKVAKDSGEHANKIGSLMIKLSVAMGLMVGVCKLVGMLSAEEMLKGAAFAAAFVIFVKALVKAVTIGKGNQMAKVGGLVLSISFSLMLMVGVCKLVGMLSAEEMLKGAAFAGAFLLFVKALVKITTVGSEKDMVKLGGTILALSVSIGILAGVSALLGVLDIASLAKGIVAVSLLGGIMALMVKSLKGAQNVQKSIMMMAVAIGVMAVAVTALSLIDTADLASATVALGSLMGMFALMTKSLKGLKKVPIAPILTMTAVIGALAGIIFLMKGIKPESAIGSSIALSALLLTMSVALKILNSIGGTARGALTGIIALTAMAIPLLAFVGILKLMDGIDGATENVKSLVILAGAITLMLIPLTIIGSFAVAAASGIIALTAMAIPLLAFVGILKLMDGIDGATANTMLLITFMSIMTDLLVKIAIVGPLAAIGVSAMTGLTLLMGAIGTMAVAIGALMDKFPSIQKFLDTGLPVLEQLAGSIGTMIGNFVGGALEGLSDSLPKIGENIAGLMEQLSIASENAAGIDGSSFDGVKQLMSVMGDIGKTTVGMSFADIFTLGGTSMQKFETDGVAFFNAMKAISQASAGITIDEAAMGAVINVATKLSELQSSLEPIGGVMDWFSGRDDLATFGTNVGQFIFSMKNAFLGLDGVSFNTEALTSIITGAAELSKLQSSLEPIGGVISWFKGRDDLGTFGTNIGQFISSMKVAFSDLEGITLNTEGLTAIISATTILSNLQSSLEPIGGVISWFKGRDDLGAFGTNVAQFIFSMKTAFQSLDGVEFNSEALTTIIEGSTKLAGLQSALEPIGGVISWFKGRDDLGTFGESIGQFISSMKTAFSSLDGVKINTEAIGIIIDAASKLSGLQSSLENIGGVVDWFTGRDDLGTFGSSVASFMGSMKTAFADLGDTKIDDDSITSIINAATKLAGLQSSLENMGGVIDWFTGKDDLGTFGENIGQFATAMGKLKTGMGEDGISEAVVTSVTNAGEAIIALQEALPEEGWFDGKMNLETFSGYVEKFSTAISTFSTDAESLNTEGINTAIAAAYRIKNLITALADLDTSGVNSFAGVGAGDGHLVNIGQAIGKFGESVADIDIAKVNTAVSVALRLKSLIASLVGLDASGIENFKISSIGKAMKDYGKSVQDMDPGIVSSSISSANRLRNFVASLAGFDSSGVENFKVGSIGTTMKKYASSVADVEWGSVSTSISVGNKLKGFINGLAGMDSSGVTKFKVGSLGSSISSYARSVAGVDYGSVSSSIAAMNKLKSFISSLSGFDGSGVSSFKSAVSSLAQTNISGMTNAFKGSTSQLSGIGTNMISSLTKGFSSGKSSLTNAATSIIGSMVNSINSRKSQFLASGRMLMLQLVNGIRSQAGAATSSVTSVVSSAAGSAMGYYGTFYSSGSYVASGFVAGIRANIGSAAAAAASMAAAASASARANLKINSPSKVFKEIGSGVPEGFALGIGMLGGLVKRSVTRMSDKAINSTQKAMTRMSNLLYGDFDSQPTIRPVLDLSDIRSGASAIDGMLNGKPSLSVMAKLGSISSTMNERNQNGAIDEVVTAINRLRKDLGNVGGTSYNINGITYDDGSNISEAIQTIVRAARIERRV